MRQALNSNPVVQMAVLGVLVVVVGLFLMMNLKKKSASTPATAASNTPAATAPATSAGATSSLPSTGTASAGAVPSAGTAVVPPSGSVTPAALTPGPGLPRDVVKAWKSGNAVVVLVFRGGGIDDRLVRQSVESLSSDSGVSVFVTRAKDVARYSRITQGLGVDRAPA